MAQRTVAKTEGTFNPRISDESLIQSAIHWRFTIQRMRYFYKRNRSSSLDLRFEDFLDNPLQRLNEIYEFLGVKALSEDELRGRLETIPYKKPMTIRVKWRGTVLAARPRIDGGTALAVSRKG